MSQIEQEILLHTPHSESQQKISEEEKERREISDRLFNYSRVMHFEKEKSRSDNFTIIYGRPRSGKTMLELGLVRNEGLIEKYKDVIFQYKVKNISDLMKYGIRPRLTKAWWKEEFKERFALDTEDANKKIKKGGYNNRISMDEGIDVASWMGGMTIEKEEWNKLLLKIGELGNTFYFITASLSLLDKNTLRRAKWFMIIAKPHKKNTNTFYLYKQWDDPIRAEKNPFDLNDIWEKIDKFKHLSTDQIYTKSRCFVSEVSYPWISKGVYDLYLKMVKRPQMLISGRRRSKYVSAAQYEKLFNYASLVTRNLRAMDDKTQNMIRKLAMTNDGKFLISPQKIKELDAYGEHLFYMYADVEEKLNEKTMAEKRAAYEKIKIEAKQREEEMQELEKLKEVRAENSWRTFRKRSPVEFSIDEEDDVPELDEKEQKSDKESSVVQ